ncbi:MAG TPA: tetratricopeptide repeat protein, partial [Polyangia bacterium]|nr:tetratricopeptide repeat protein [Polyangia bacterium]
LDHNTSCGGSEQVIRLLSGLRPGAFTKGVAGLPPWVQVQDSKGFFAARCQVLQYLHDGGFDGVECQDVLMRWQAESSAVRGADPVQTSFFGPCPPPAAVSATGPSEAKVGTKGNATLWAGKPVADPPQGVDPAGPLEEASTVQVPAAAADPTAGIDLENASQLNRRGGQLLQEGKLEESLALFDRAIALDSKMTGAMTNRGYALLRLGRLDDASSSANQALASSAAPRIRASAKVLLGRVAETQGDAATARARFQEALAEQPGYPQALQGLADLSSKAGATPRPTDTRWVDPFAQ